VLSLALGLGLTHRGAARAQQPSPPMPMAGQDLSGLAGDAFDQAFLEQMIMHHAMAVMMAEHVVQGAVHPEVGNLAANIISAQTNEIAEMRGWLKDWYGIDMPDPMAMMSSMMQTGMPAGDHAHGAQPDQPGTMPSQGMPMPGMTPGPAGMMPGGMPAQGMPSMDMSDMAADMMAMMMQQYGSLPGPRLEAVFLSLMIPHHQAAIEMANLAPQRAAHRELADLAASIVSSQSAEIQQMNGWLGAWYGL
jgi:uncharacterized protein (DUF305 family)